MYLEKRIVLDVKYVKFTFINYLLELFWLLKLQLEAI